MIWLLKRQLRARLSATRAEAVRKLAENGSPAAIQALAGAVGLHEGWPRTTSELAAEALGRLKAERGVPRLLEEFRGDPGMAFRDAAGDALLAIGTPEAVEGLCAIAETEGSAQNDAVCALMGARTDHPEVVRIASALAKVLLEWRTYKSPEYTNATEGLARIFRSSDDPGLSAVKPEVAAHAAEVLRGEHSKLVPIEATPRLLGALGETKVLVEFLQRPDDQRPQPVAEAAIWVLVELSGAQRPDSSLSDYARGEWAWKWWWANEERLVEWARENAIGDGASPRLPDPVDPISSAPKE